MIDKIRYDIYHNRKDRSLRSAALPGAKLPAHLSPKDWTLMPLETSPVHSGAAQDIVAKGYWLFQIVVGD